MNSHFNNIIDALKFKSWKINQAYLVLHPFENCQISKIMALQKTVLPKIFYIPVSSLLLSDLWAHTNEDEFWFSL